MSDNDDLLGEDLGDQSLADYNLGNEEEEQLLADDFEHVPQNVPGRGYRVDADVANYGHRVEFTRLPSLDNYPALDSECVVPNVPVEIGPGPVGSLTVRNYAPYGEVPVYEHDQHGVVPPAIPAAPLESPQIVPSELQPPIIANGDNARERFTSERPPGVQRTPQVRDIPDSLDKVYVPRVGYVGRGGHHRPATSWRNPHYQPRPFSHSHSHPYRRNNTNRGHFLQQQPQRPSFPQPQLRSSPPRIRPEPQIRLEPPQMRLEEPQPEPHLLPDIPQMSTAPPRPPYRPVSPNMERPFQPNAPFSQRPTYPQSGPPVQNLNFRLETSPPRPNYPIRPPFEPRFQFQQRPNFNERPFPPPAREIAPNNISHMPQVTIRQAVPMGLPAMGNTPKLEEFVPKLGNRPPEYNPREPEVRMLPVQLPTNLPPGGLAGKKVLINPHFKGNFQPPVEELATYIPTRIQKSPPPSPTYEIQYAGPVQNVDDAAERFIAEQRNALARAATRKYPRRSPQRYIENTTIEIENELAQGERAQASGHDADLLRRQEEFINANRAGLRRRMRSPSPVGRRSLSPRRSPRSPPSPRRPRGSPPRHHGPLDEESEYRRRLREQESMRERVLRAKEVRRKKNAVALQKQIQDRERERQNPDKSEKVVPEKPAESSERYKDQNRQQKYDIAPRIEIPPSQKNNEQEKQDNQNLTPPRINSETDTRKFSEIDTKSSKNDTKMSSNNDIKRSLEREVAKKSPERALTPPLPVTEVAESVKIAKMTDFDDDDLDLILDDIEGILSDDEDTGRFKEKPKKAPSPPAPAPPPKSKPTARVDLRQKLPPKSASAAESKTSLPRQKIVYNEDKEKEKKRKERTPPKRNMVSSSTNTEESLTRDIKNKSESKREVDTNTSKRPRIIFGNKEVADADALDDKSLASKPSAFNNRRVVLQRKVAQEKPFSLPLPLPRSDKNDPSRPNPGIFSRAMQKAIGNTIDNSRLVLKQQEPKIEYEMDSDIDEDALLSDNANLVALVTNLPFGMTEMRLRTLAGDGVQHINLDKDDRRATITFKSTDGAENFRKKFNNKMVAASRLSVVLA